MTVFLVCRPALHSWQQRAFVKAPLADLLLPEDIQRGYIYEPHPTASVLDWLLQAVQQWEAEGGESQVRCRALGLIACVSVSQPPPHHTRC